MLTLKKKTIEFKTSDLIIDRVELIKLIFKLLFMNYISGRVYIGTYKMDSNRIF